MSVVNYTSASRSALGSATDTLAYGAAVVSGDLLFVVIRMGTGATLNTVADSVNAGNWTLLGPTDNVGRQYMAYKENTGVGTPTLTFTFSASGQSPRYAMGEVTNTIGVGSFDASDILATGTSATPAANAQTGATATEAHIGLLSMSADQTFSQSGSWTVLGVEPGAGTSRLAVVYQEVTTSASRAPTASGTASTTWLAFGFLVKQNAGTAYSQLFTATLRPTVLNLVGARNKYGGLLLALYYTQSEFFAQRGRIFTGTLQMGSGVPDPSSVSGLLRWYKADALALNDGDLVATWTDSSGNANATAAGVARPTYKTAMLNGRPVVRFDGVGNWMSFTATPAVANWSAFAVIRTQATSARLAMLGSVTFDTWYVGEFTPGTSGENLFNLSSSVPSGTFDGTLFSTIEIVVSGTLASYYRNGVAIGTDNSVNASATFDAVGATNNGASFLDGLGFGDVAELTYFNRALADPERLTLEQYFDRKYLAPPLVKKTSQGLSAVLSFIGNLNKRFPQTMTATLSFIANLNTRFPQDLAATLSFVGSTAKRTTRNLGSTALSFIGGLGNMTSRTLLSTLFFDGITFVAEAHGDASFAASPTINKPTGTVVGHVMVAVIMAESSAGVPGVTAPSGWTLFKSESDTTSSHITLLGYYLVAGPNEPSSYTWTIAGPGNGLGMIATYTGVDTGTVMDVTATSAHNNNSTNPTSPAITTVSSFSTILSLIHVNAAFVTNAPAGMTNRRTLNSSEENIADAVNVAAGTYTPAAWIHGTGGWQAITAALRPAYGASFIKKTLRILAATLSFIGNYTSPRVKLLTAALSFIGTLNKRFPQNLSGVLNLFSGVGGTPYSGVVLADTPIAFWRLDETSGTIAKDSSGNGNDGTYTGGFTLGGASLLGSEQNGRSVALNGSTGFINGPDINAIDGSAALTVEAWIKPTSVGSAQVVVAKWDVQTDGTFSFDYGATTGRMDGLIPPTLTSGWGTTGVQTPAVLNTGAQHVVMVYDGSLSGNTNRVKNYLNGQLQTAASNFGTVPATLPAAGAATVKIGKLGGTITQFMNGSVSNVSLYTSALSASQVSAHYRAGTDSFLKKTLKSLTAALSFIGNIATLYIAGGLQMAFTATLSFIGAQSKQTNHRMTAVLSFIGNFIYPWRQTAALSFVGSLPKQTGRAVAGTLSFVGAQAKQAGKAVAGALSFIGTQSKQTNHRLTAALSFIGNFVYPARFTAALAFVGAVVKQTARPLAAALAFIGTFSRTLLKIMLLTGTLSFIGAQAKRTNKSLSATASFIANFVYPARFAAALSFVGTAAKRTSRSLTATLSFLGTMLRAFPKVLTGTLSFIGAQTKQTGKSLTATLSFIGAQARRVTHLLTATLSFVGNFRWPVRLTAALSFVGSTTKQTIRSLTGGLTFIGTFFKQTGKALTAALTWSGSISRFVTYPMTAALSFGGAMTKFTQRALTAATLSFIGAFVGTSHILTLLALNAALAFNGAMTKSTRRLMTAQLGFIGAISRVFGRVLTAVLSSAGTVNRSVRRVLTAGLSFRALIRRNRTFLRGFAEYIHFFGYRVDYEPTTARGLPTYAYQILGTTSYTSGLTGATLYFSDNGG